MSVLAAQCSCSVTVKAFVDDPHYGLFTIKIDHNGTDYYANLPRFSGKFINESSAARFRITSRSGQFSDFVDNVTNFAVAQTGSNVTINLSAADASRTTATITVDNLKGYYVHANSGNSSTMMSDGEGNIDSSTRTATYAATTGNTTTTITGDNNTVVNFNFNIHPVITFSRDDGEYDDNDAYLVRQHTARRGNIKSGQEHARGRVGRMR